MKKKMIACCLIACLIVAGLVYISARNNRLDVVIKRTERLDSFEMGISTIVNLSDENIMRQSVLDQVLTVKKRSGANMHYKVETTATISNGENGDVTVEENSYIYYKNNYYHSYPGVNYYGATNKESAENNLNNIKNIISFPYEKMYDIEKVDDNVYSYKVDWKDASALLKATLQAAVNQFENSSFEMSDVSATIKVADGYVAEQSFFISYVGNNGEEIRMEIYTSLLDNEASVEVPDKNKYVSIMK